MVSDVFCGIEYPGLSKQGMVGELAVRTDLLMRRLDCIAAKIGKRS